MRISKLVSYDLKNIMTSWLTYFSIVLCVLPAFGIAYSVANFKGPSFEVIQLTYFFAFFGSLLVVIIAMLSFTKDLSQNTITLMMNEKSKRIQYYIAKVITIAIIGLIFGIAGTLSTYLLAEYAGLEMASELFWQITVHYILYALFYGTLFLTISTFYTNVLALFIVAVLSIMMLPTLFDGLLLWNDLPEWMGTFITDWLPLYFISETIGSHNWIAEHYISTIIAIVLFIVIGIMRIRTKDY
ncbi:MAG: hypothetical protein ACTH14_01485 [Jeotgalicoccus sp.]